MGRTILQDATIIESLWDDQIMWRCFYLPDYIDARKQYPDRPCGHTCYLCQASESCSERMVYNAQKS